MQYYNILISLSAMKKFKIKLFILCIPFFQSAIFGMDLQALKEEFEASFPQIASYKEIPSENNISTEQFSKAVERNDLKLVRRYLHDKTFKETIDSHTLCQAYIVAHNKKYVNLRIGISMTLQKLFPRDFETMKQNDKEQFLNAIKESNTNEINNCLNDNTFIDKVPLYILQGAHTRTVKQHNDDLANKIRSIIQQKMSWKEIMENM